MKIIETKKENGAHEYKFDNGAWASVCTGNDYGSWEYQSDEDDEETYSEGGLWFEGKVVTDFDGCYDLPEEVRMALSELGYTLDE
jgi:hypothetical protein